MTDERRNYFRMAQRVAMAVKPLDPARATDPAAPLTDDGTQRFRLLSELEAMHAESESMLASRLLLLPERAGLLLKSRVLRATPADGRYQIHREFLHVSESDRAIITRHLLQVEQRKRALEGQL